MNGSGLATSFEAIPAVLLLFGACGHAPTVMAQSAGVFTATGNMSTPRIAHTATLLTNDMILIAGGLTDVMTPRSLQALNCTTLPEGDLPQPAAC